MKTKSSYLLDLVIFQIAWFCCVLAPLSPIPQALPVTGLVLVLIRTQFSRGLKEVLPFAIACFLLGVAGDAGLVQLGLLSFDAYPDWFGAPLWMVALWLNFGLMLRPLFTWFLDHCWRAIIGFSAGGVVAYYSGQKLGVLTLTVDIQSQLGVAAEWAIAGIILRYLHLKFPSTPQENEHA